MTMFKAGDLVSRKSLDLNNWFWTHKCPKEYKEKVWKVVANPSKASGLEMTISCEETFLNVCPRFFNLVEKGKVNLNDFL